MKKITYRCEFRFKGTLLRRDASTPEAFMEGFWIGEDTALAVPWGEAEPRFWIPPHAIEYIAIDAKG